MKIVSKPELFMGAEIAMIVITTEVDGHPMPPALFMRGPKTIIRDYFDGKLTLAEALTKIGEQRCAPAT